jgi:hypothetical protein
MTTLMFAATYFKTHRIPLAMTLLEPQMPKTARKELS